MNKLLKEIIIYPRRLAQMVSYTPKMIAKATNWYDYYFDCLHLKRGDWIMNFKNGIKIFLRKGSVDKFSALESLILFDDSLSYFEKHQYETIVDVGAHIGDSTIAFANNFKKSNIIAIEPIEESVAVLKKNIELNKLKKRVKVIQAALTSNKDGKVTLFENTNSAAPSLIRDSAGTKIAVPAISLKTLEKEIEGKALLKLDIEGGEYDILSKKNLKFLDKFDAFLIESHYVDKKKNIHTIKKFFEKNNLGDFVIKNRFFYVVKN